MPRAKADTSWVASERWATRDPILMMVHTGLPPSLNHQYQPSSRGHGARILSDEARAYKHAVAEQAARNWNGSPLPPTLDVEVWLYVPTLRTRDVDNCLKLLLDGLAEGLEINDSRIVDLVVHKRQSAESRCVLLVRGTREKEASRE